MAAAVPAAAVITPSSQREGQGKVRPVRFEPVEPTSTANEVFFKGPVNGKIFHDTHYTGKSRQIFNNTYDPFHNGLFRNCQLSGQRYKKSSSSWPNKSLVHTKWLIRLYDVKGTTVEHCEFFSWVQEHDIYINVVGSNSFINNYFRGAHSQAIQTVFRESETSDASQINNSGRMLIASNLVVNCGHTGHWYTVGNARPGFAFSQHQCIKGMEVAYHGNHLVQRGTGPFNYSGGKARSFGAIMCEHKKYSEGIGNTIDYRQPSDRPIIQLEKNRSDYWEGNTIVKGGTVAFIEPNDAVWKNNSGVGRVIWKTWDKPNQRYDTVDLGPVTGHYEFANGKQTK